MKKVYFSLTDTEQILVDNNKDLNFLTGNKFYKVVWETTLPIYLQLISTVVLSMINNLLLRWVDGGIWTAAINKANYAYSWFVFIPTFAAGGVFVAIGNVIGKNKREDIYKVVLQGLVFNLLLCLVVVVGLYFSKNLMYSWVNLDNKNEIKYANYLYYTNLVVILLTSINTIFQRVEASSGNLKKLFIVVLLSSLINTIIVASTMFVINPIISIAIATFVSAIFLTIATFWLNSKHVNFKKMFTNNKACWESWIIKTLLIVSIPTIVETLFFNFAVAFSTKYVTLASSIYGEEDILFNTLVSVQQITNFGLLMSSALGQVAMIFVSRLYGSSLQKLCIPTSKKIWYLTLVVALPFSLATLLLSYPLLLIYNIPPNIILNIGIFMFLIICLQDFGRSMNQVGLSSLRAVKYTIVPVIVSMITLSVFNVGFIYLSYYLMIKGQSSVVLAKNFMLVICLIQAIEEVVRGSLYLIIWVSGVWLRKTGNKNEENKDLRSSTRTLG